MIKGSHTFYRIDVRCYWPQKKPKKNSRMRIKDGGNNDAIPDLMIEVGLDGTIYNYHSHRKDSFIGHGSIYR
jgi:hypothetical protein